ncbi:MAG: MotA/TolQ/ExbB proton channel family protein [Pseudomonadota bacterium]|nr:MotA/TolQ/ExbB proton channel family protein [Pseudomonadota bacterium]
MEFDIVKELLAISLLGTEWVLWLLVLLSVLSVTIMLERGWCFLTLRIDFTHFSHELQRCLHSQEHDRALQLCAQSKTPESSIALVACENINASKDEIAHMMLATQLKQRQRLERGLVVLGTLGNNAPFIGLFGTVLGIIQAFNALSLNPAGGVAVVMAGISEALVATAIGLLVAIPAVIAFNGFQRLVKKRLANTDALMKMMLAYRGEQ